MQQIIIAKVQCGNVGRQESCSLVPWACQIIMFILVMVKCYVKRFYICEVN